MGRKNQKVYEYTRNGKFVKEYESITDFAKKNDVKKVIFSNKSRIFNNIYDCKNNNIASLHKLGNKGVLKYLQYRKSRFVGKSKHIAEARLKNNNKGKVIFYDLDMEKIAEFKSSFQARLLTGLNESCFAIPPNKFKKTRGGIYIEVLKVEES